MFDLSKPHSRSHDGRIWNVYSLLMVGVPGINQQPTDSGIILKGKIITT
jgi:hypothetical protein